MTRVLVVDDDHLMRAGLIELLGADTTIDIVGHADSGTRAVELAQLLHPDVILMDVRMPNGDGITATRTIVADQPTTRILILTTFDQDDYLFDALAAGASGFLLKRARPEELIAAVHTIAAGDALLAPAVTRRVLDRIDHPSARTTDSRLATLTGRERDVLGAIARGLSNAEIASELVIEESTVRTHTKHLFAKLDLRDRVQAVIYAYRNGLAR